MLKVKNKDGAFSKIVNDWKLLLISKKVPS